MPVTLQDLAAAMAAPYGDDQQGSTTFRSRLSWLLGVIGLSGGLYAVGYAISVGYYRALGVYPIDVSSEDIFNRAVFSLLLSALCMLMSLMHWQTWLVLLLSGLAAGIPYFPALVNRRNMPSEGGPPRQDGFWRRLGRGFGVIIMLAACYLLLLGILVFAFHDVANIFGQAAVLLTEESSPCGPAVTDSQPGKLCRSGWMGTELHLKSLLAAADEDPRRALFGLLLVCLVATSLGCYWADRGCRRHVQRRWLVTAASGLIVLLLAILWLTIPFLYGFLVPDYKFPILEITQQALLGAGDSGDKTACQRNGVPPQLTEVAFLGKRGDVAVVYWREKKQVRWLPADDLAPARLLNTANLFLPTQPSPTVAVPAKANSTPAETKTP